MNSNAKISDGKINIELSRAEAVVLFDVLSRFSNEDKLEIQDHAEERVLWRICCELETMLDEPFRTDYGDILQKARSIVREG